MNSKVESQASGFDTLKLWVAALLVAAAMGAFYYFADASVLVRVLGILASIITAGFIGYQTEVGRRFADFLRESQIEVRKVVWPTRSETIKTTWVVVAVVVVMGVLLWLLDMLIAWVVRLLTTIGG
ncbi:MAG: Protein translocase subunit SecE [Gammaproteobacteria bacterium]|nr:Protein translocase subunit SecE [Gammaproteobacteria bacterium]